MEWAIRGEKLGAGELVLNSIDADGVKTGFDIELNRTVSKAVQLPVIASGGAGTKEHFLEVFAEGKADAGTGGQRLPLRRDRYPELKRYLKDNGINMRI